MSVAIRARPRPLNIAAMAGVGAGVLTAAVLTACDAARSDTDRPDEARVTVVDSAGVAIVESAGPAWTEERAWRLADGAALVIASEGDGYELSGVFSALRLHDGTLVVPNNSDNRLLFFDPDGALRAKAGRDGAGPGEFRDLWSIWPYRGDSILAHDWVGSRLSVWKGPELGRMAPLRSPDGGQLVAWGAFGDGSLLIARTPNRPPNTPLGLRSDSSPLLRYGPEAEPGDTLGAFPWRESYRLHFEGGLTYTDPPFARYAVVTPLHDGFVVGPARTAEVEVYDGAGRLRRIIRFPGEPRAVGAADRATFRRERIRFAAGYGAPPEETERLLAELEFPDRMPTYESIRVDPAGNLWIDEYDPDPLAGRAWRVLSSDGAYLGDVQVPPGFLPLDIGDDYVLGRVMSELHEESLALYELIKPGPRP